MKNFFSWLYEILFNPFRSMKMRYLPVMAVYFAFGMSAFTGISASVWVKDHLHLSAAALAAVGFWVGIPWATKMIFGQMVDSFSIFGSARRSYIFIAALLMTLSTLLMAGLAGDWPSVLALGTPVAIYTFSAILTAIAFVLQDVVADTMTVEVVPATHVVNGSVEPRLVADINEEKGRVQTLGRLSLMLAVFLVSGLGGWLGDILSTETIYLISLVIPLVSISGALLVKLERTAPTPPNWAVLGGGIVFAMFAIAMGLSKVPYGQEIVFVVSLSAVIFFISRITKEVQKETMSRIIAAGIIVFAFRAMPGVGPGYTWWELDVLHFDQAFLGTLSEISSILTILGIWIGMKWIAKGTVGGILGTLTVIGTVLSIPPIAVFYGLDKWTEAHFGFGARTIMLTDIALESPFSQVSMVVVLSMVAYYATKKHTATWFALAGSFMNLGLSASTLSTKYLNQIFVVTREMKDKSGNVISQADFSNLGTIMIVSTVIGFVVPMLVIVLLAKRAQPPKQDPASLGSAKVGTQTAA